MSTIQIELPREYPVALLLVGGISLMQHYSTLWVVAKRKEIYGRYKFMDNFKEEHAIAFGENNELHPHGDPDNVDGWYSRKLSYKEWY